MVMLKFTYKYIEQEEIFYEEKMFKAYQHDSGRRIDCLCIGRL